MIAAMIMLGAWRYNANSADADQTPTVPAQTKCDAPLPDQGLLARYKEMGEAPQVPADLKPFIGVWKGAWDDPASSSPLCSIIVITYDAADHGGQPRAFYAVGSAPWVVPRNELVRGRLKEGHLELIEDGDVVLATLTRKGDALVGLHARTKTPGLFRKVSDLQAEVQ